MTDKKRSVEYDKTGSPFVDAPRKNTVGKVRVSFVRQWYSPPVTPTGKVDYDSAAEELSQEITGGKLRFSNYVDDDELGFSAEVKITSRSELDALLRAIRAVFKEGVRQSNVVRQAALARCEERIAGAAGRRWSGQHERRVNGDRRNRIERRSMERRSEQLPTTVDQRTFERRDGEERRSGMERRAA